MGHRLLVIARSYYPSDRPGAHRVAKLVKYLPKYGWDPTVICPEWTPDNSGERYSAALEGTVACPTERVSYRTFRARSVRGLFDRGCRYFTPTLYPVGLYRAMRLMSMEVAARSHFDAILASCPPVMTLRIASQVSRWHGIPWVADFRDLPDELESQQRWASAWHRRSEGAACNNASALVTVSQPLAEKLQARHRAPVFVVSNGFDQEDFTPSRRAPADIFRLTYGGRVYNDRDPGVFLDGLDLFVAEAGCKANSFRAQFYGPCCRNIAGRIRGRPCERVIDMMGTVPSHEMHQIEQASTALLFLPHSRSKGIMTSKIFDCLGAATPILSVPGDNDCTDDLLSRTGAGIVARTRSEVANTLNEWYRIWRKTGTLPYQGRPSAINEYTRDKQAARMAEVLDRLRRQQDQKHRPPTGELSPK